MLTNKNNNDFKSRFLEVTVYKIYTCVLSKFYKKITISRGLPVSTSRTPRVRGLQFGKRCSRVYKTSYYFLPRVCDVHIPSLYSAVLPYLRPTHMAQYLIRWSVLPSNFFRSVILPDLSFCFCCCCCSVILSIFFYCSFSSFLCRFIFLRFFKELWQGLSFVDWAQAQLHVKLSEKSLYNDRNINHLETRPLFLTWNWNVTYRSLTVNENIYKFSFSKT